MNVNTQLMMQYAEFLENKSREIQGLCTEVEQLMQVAVQCMDQQSGHNAAARLAQNMENIRANVPVSDDAAKRLILSKHMVDGAMNVFGGR